MANAGSKLCDLRLQSSQMRQSNLKLWRVVTKERAEGAFSGEGSVRYSGRWHSKGMKQPCVTGKLRDVKTLLHPRPLRITDLR